jgi:hypothetical protein
MNHNKSLNDDQKIQDIQRILSTNNQSNILCHNLLLHRKSLESELKTLINSQEISNSLYNDHSNWLSSLQRQLQRYKL